MGIHLIHLPDACAPKHNKETASLCYSVPDILTSCNSP